MIKVDQLLQEVIKEAKALNIPVSENIIDEVEIKKAKSFFGRCTKKGNGKFQIIIIEALTKIDEKYLKQTLAHEILHTIQECFNHGSIWKWYANCMNQAYGYKIARTSSQQNMQIQPSMVKAKYLIKCNECGNETYHVRATKVITQTSRYKCKCGGKLTVTTL